MTAASDTPAPASSSAKSLPAPSPPPAQVDAATAGGRQSGGRLPDERGASRGGSGVGSVAAGHFALDRDAGGIGWRPGTRHRVLAADRSSGARGLCRRGIPPGRIAAPAGRARLPGCARSGRRQIVDHRNSGRAPPATPVPAPGTGSKNFSDRASPPPVMSTECGPSAATGATAREREGMTRRRQKQVPGLWLCWLVGAVKSRREYRTATIRCESTGLERVGPIARRRAHSQKK